MSGVLRPRIVCDGGCGRHTDAPAPDWTLTSLRDAAEAEGWVYTWGEGGEILDACPREACQDTVAAKVYVS